MQSDETIGRRQRPGKGRDISTQQLGHQVFNGRELDGLVASHASLKDTKWIGAKLRHAKFNGAKLHRADFRSADLTGADFRGARLHGASFFGAVLDGADFAGAHFCFTQFAATDLSRVIGLSEAYCHGPSNLGIDTLLRTDPLPERFARNAGVPQEIIEAVHAVKKRARPHRVFISYSAEEAEDASWVEQLALQLEGHGIHVTIDKWDLLPGDSLFLFMEDGIGSMTCGIFVATPQAKLRADAESHYIGHEKRHMALGMIHGTKVIPIVRRAPGGIPSVIPRFLNGIYAQDFTDDELFYENVGRLAKAIRGESWRPDEASR